MDFTEAEWLGLNRGRWVNAEYDAAYKSADNELDPVKRASLFFTGFGLGRHARAMMAATLLCVEDTTEAAAIDAQFDDIAAYLRSLRAPPFPGEIKAALEGLKCRCGTHMNILRAVKRAATMMG